MKNIITFKLRLIMYIGAYLGIPGYKEMSLPELNFKKPDFFRDNFEVVYFVIALACARLLVAMVAVSYITVGYNLDRLYAVGITILSVFFVIGEDNPIWKGSVHRVP